MRRWLIGALAMGALAAGAYVKGRGDGRALEAAAQAQAVAALQARLFDTAEQSSRRAAEVAALVAAQELAAMEAEDGARNDVSVGVPGPDSLRRLRARWGAPAAP